MHDARLLPRWGAESGRLATAALSGWWAASRRATGPAFDYRVPGLAGSFSPRYRSIAAVIIFKPRLMVV